MNGLPGAQKSSFVPGVNPPTGIWNRKMPGSGKGRIYLYGLYDDSGRCHYAGQTLNPRQRRSQHAKPDLILRVLRRCRSTIDSTRIETQIIRAYKRRGQCKLNKKERGPSAKARWTNPVLWVEKNKAFGSPADAARYFRVCSWSILDWIKNGAPWYRRRKPTLKFLLKRA